MVKVFIIHYRFQMALIK